MTRVKETISCGCCVVKIENGIPKILLVRPSFNRDVWGIPKGHLNNGESKEDCAKRETLEETGIHVKLLKKLGNVLCSHKSERKTVHTWLALQTNSEESATPSDGENAEVEWFTFDALPQIHIYQRSLIEEVIEVVYEQLGGIPITLPQSIIEGIQEVAKYYPVEETNWVVFKKELLKNLKPDDRINFSTRDPKTKKQSLNNFEREIIQFWLKQTGNLLTLRA